jgi:hypothetical protein
VRVAPRLLCRGARVDGDDDHVVVDDGGNSAARFFVPVPATAPGFGV